MESSLEIHTNRELGILSVSVVDEVNLRIGRWRSGHFDHPLASSAIVLVEDIDDALLLWRRNDDGFGSFALFRKADEENVVLYLRWRDAWWWSAALLRLFGSVEDEYISRDYRPDACAIYVLNLSIAASST